MTPNVMEIYGPICPTLVVLLAEEGTQYLYTY